MQQVLIPPLGTTVDTITFVSWYKKEGDVVRKGEPLYVIETDKANLDIEAPASGILRGVIAHEGDEFKALTPIAYILKEGETLPAAEEIPPEPATAPPVKEPSAPPRAEKAGRVLISPRARRLAEANQIPLAELEPTGPEGAIIERDVRRWLSSHAEALAAVSAGQQEQPKPAGVLPSAVASYYCYTVEVNAGRYAALYNKLQASGLQVTNTTLFAYIISRQLAAFPLYSQSGGQIAPAIAVMGQDDYRIIPLEQRNGLRLAEMAAFSDAAKASPVAGISQDGEYLAVLDVGEYGLDTYSPVSGGINGIYLCLGRLRVQGEQISLWLSLTASPSVLASLQAAQFLRQVARLIEDPELLLAI